MKENSCWCLEIAARCPARHGEHASLSVPHLDGAPGDCVHLSSEVKSPAQPAHTLHPPHTPSCSHHGARGLAQVHQPLPAIRTTWQSCPCPKGTDWGLFPGPRRYTNAALPQRCSHAPVHLPNLSPPRAGPASRAPYKDPLRATSAQESSRTGVSWAGLLGQDPVCPASWSLLTYLRI